MTKKQISPSDYDSLNVEIIAELHQTFVQNSWTLGLAESCTGGLVSSEITRRAGVSNFFQGSIVSYALSVKHEVFGIPWDILNKDDGVSTEVALLMAQGSRMRLKCDWGLAITGYAGPKGGSVDKPVGTVCIAVSGKGFEVVETNHFEGSRQQIQVAATHRALTLLLETVRKGTRT